MFTLAIEPKNAKAANNSHVMQIHTISPINIFPKKDRALTSFGALSNIATSGFSKTF
jgi:hypothetical protein